MNPTKKPNRRMDLGFFAAGICLIWMPSFAVFDLLPAYIGYLLIFRGLYRLADIDENIADARRLFGRMAILSTIRLVAVPVSFGFINAYQRPLVLLIITFSLGLLDLITLVPAWRKLSQGMIYLATRHDGVAMFAVKGNSRRSLTENLTSFTLVFFVIKEIMAVLPESTSLTSQAGGAEPGSAFYFPYLYEYIGLMRSFSVLVMTIFGVVWLVRMWKHMRRVIADHPFFERLQDKYAAEVMTRPDLFAKRRIKAALVVICIGLCFALDLYFDDINFTPDFLVGFLMIAGLLMLRRYVYTNVWVSAVVTTTLYTAAAAAASTYHFICVHIEEISFIDYDEEILTKYILLCALQIISQLLFIIALFWIIRTLRIVVKQYTGFSVTEHDIPHVREVHKSLYFKLWIFFAFAILAVASSVAYWLILPNAANTLWELIIPVENILQVIMPVSFIFAISAIFEQIEYKYMLS